MDPVYRIAKWNEVFENSESRKLKTLSWVAFPVDLNSNGFHSLIETFGDDAPTVYGAWAALVCVAAKCPQRGVLASSNGVPKPLPRIAVEARFPLGVMERLWQWATRKDVAWIEVASGVDAPVDAIETRPPETPGESPDEPGLEHEDTTRPGMELPDTTDRPDVGVRAGGRDAIAGTRIVCTTTRWREMLPTMSRIARVVTRDPNVIESRLRPGDRELCAVAAALTHFHFNEAWLVAILKSIQNRKTPADNPWGHFRGCLIKASQRRGVEFHDLEASVVLPSEVVAKRSLATPANGLSAANGVLPAAGA